MTRIIFCIWAGFVRGPTTFVMSARGLAELVTLFDHSPLTHRSLHRLWPHPASNPFTWLCTRPYSTQSILSRGEGAIACLSSCFMASGGSCRDKPGAKLLTGPKSAPAPRGTSPASTTVRGAWSSALDRSIAGRWNWAGSRRPWAGASDNSSTPAQLLRSASGQAGQRLRQHAPAASTSWGLEWAEPSAATHQPLPLLTLKAQRLGADVTAPGLL